MKKFSEIYNEILKEGKSEQILNPSLQTKFVKAFETEILKLQKQNSDNPKHWSHFIGYYVGDLPTAKAEGRENKVTIGFHLPVNPIYFPELKKGKDAISVPVRIDKGEIPPETQKEIQKTIEKLFPNTFIITDTQIEKQVQDKARNFIYYFKFTKEFEKKQGF